MSEFYIVPLVFLMMWGAHWMPWQVIPMVTNERGDLHRPLAYVYGCLVIFGGFSLWALTQPGQFVTAVDALMSLALVILSAGAGTMLPRAITLLWKYQQLERDVDGYENGAQ